jgi:GTP-binding protein HflX
MRPRLKNLWEHLSRQDGGIGTRGPGETQLEVDRRRVNEKIAHLKAELGDRRKVADTQRKSRRGTFAAALVGYTNAGKSSLMNALAGTELLTENKLFSTLDATTRRISLARGEQVLLTDTVGFIRKLPHDLVASFRATLEEAVAADVVLHVVDVSRPAWEEQMAVVGEVLEDAGLRDGGTAGRVILALNKADRLDEADREARLGAARARGWEAVLVSAVKGSGLSDLATAVTAAAGPSSGRSV